MRLQRLTIRGFAILWMLAAAIGSASAMSRAEYRSLLASMSQRLNAAISAESRLPGSSKPGVRRLLASLPPRGASVDGVTCGLEAFSAELHSTLRLTGAKRIDRLRRLSEETRARLTMFDARIDLSNEEVTRARELLDKELKANEYRESWFRRVIVGALEKLFTAIGRLFESTPAGDAVVGVIGRVLFWLAVAALVAAVVWLTLKFVRGLPIGFAAESSEGDPDSTSVSGAPALVRQAEAYAEAGKFLEAFRAVYLASLYLLNAKHVIAYTKSGTNWEYLRCVRQAGNAAATDAFSQMTLIFDDLVYGQRGVSADDYARCRDGYRRLEELT